MGSDPTQPISWDYLIELSDDGSPPDQPEPEVITIPPVDHAGGVYNGLPPRRPKLGDAPEEVP